MTVQWQMIHFSSLEKEDITNFVAEHPGITVREIITHFDYPIPLHRAIDLMYKMPTVLVFDENVYTVEYHSKHIEPEAY